MIFWCVTEPKQKTKREQLEEQRRQLLIELERIKVKLQGVEESIAELDND